MDEDIAAPAVFDRLLDIPNSLFRVRNPIEDANIVSPRNLCNSLLHNCLVRPGLGESPHVL
jgi:hypothetical protein